MAEEIEFENRMSETDALLWHVEQDPLLRSTIMTVWVMDHLPPRDELHDRIELAARMLPRMRQRVVTSSFSVAPPRWDEDPDFDLDYHVRWVRAPGSGTMRDLLDVAQPMAMQSFDKARPLWEMAVIEGLEDGRAGIVLKLHHALSDGVGLVRMTASLIDNDRQQLTLDDVPPPPPGHTMNMAERVLDALGHQRRRQLDITRRTWNAVSEGIGSATRHPVEAARDVTDAIASVGRLLAPQAEPSSPLMKERSLRLHLDSFVIALDDLKRASRAAGGKLNDAFMAAISGGFRIYHEKHGAAVDSLRTSMPVNLRNEATQNVAGNQFVPVRFPVPIAETDPVARMKEIRTRVESQLHEPALPLFGDISALLTRFPTAVLTAALGTMLKGVDFVASNVPGPPIPVSICGAKITDCFGFGPLGGAAVNVTLFSYDGDLRIAVTTDRAAVPDFDFFLDCLRRGFDEVLASA